MQDGYIINTICPKCTSIQAHYLVEDDELILKCLCGFYKVLYSERYGRSVIHVVKEDVVSIPKAGTKLSKCLGALAKYHPAIVSTGDIARDLEVPGGVAASRLMVLQHKGLIEVVVCGRGKVGGSTWKLTTRAVIYLNLE